MEEARRREENFIREEEARLLYENFCYRKIQEEMNKMSEDEQCRLRAEAIALANKMNKYKAVETIKTSISIAMAEIIRRRVNLPTFGDWYKDISNRIPFELPALPKYTS